MGLPQNDLFASKHNPSFVDRTLAARLEIEDLLSSMRRQLAMIVLRQDEVAFEDLYQRVKRAGRGFTGEKVIMPERMNMLLKGDVWYGGSSTNARAVMSAQSRGRVQKVQESTNGEDEAAEEVVGR